MRSSFLSSWVRCFPVVARARVEPRDVTPVDTVTRREADHLERENQRAADVKSVVFVPAMIDHRRTLFAELPLTYRSAYPSAPFGDEAF